MNILKDLRIIKAICKKYNMEYDKQYKYITKDYNNNILLYKNDVYKLQYFDGCFYPYIIKLK